MSWYVAVLKKYVDFSGRARRKEYWMFSLINGIISCTLLSLAAVFSILSFESGDNTLFQVISLLFSLLLNLYSLAVIIPTIAVLVRRLHDIGKSGLCAFWLLLLVIPLVNLIIAVVFLIFLVRDSQPGTNQFGPNPKHTFAGQ